MNSLCSDKSSSSDENCAHHADVDADVDVELCLLGSFCLVVCLVVWLYDCLFCLPLFC